MRILYTSRVDPLHRDGVGSFHHNKLEEEIQRRGWHLTLLTSALGFEQDQDRDLNSDSVRKVFLARTTPDRLDNNFTRAVARFVADSQPFDLAVFSAFSGVDLQLSALPISRALHFLHNSWSTIHPPKSNQLELRRRLSRARGY